MISAAAIFRDFNDFVYIIVEQGTGYDASHLKNKINTSFSGKPFSIIWT